MIEVLFGINSLRLGGFHYYLKEKTRAQNKNEQVIKM